MSSAQEQTPGSAGDASVAGGPAPSTPPVSAPSTDSQASSRMPSAPAGSAGPSHMDTNQEIPTGKNKYKYRKPAPKGRERVYTVFPKPTNVGVLPGALKVHPKGFKLLSARSPLDRNLTTYFRMPPQPPKRILAEQQHLAKTIDKHVAPGKHVKGIILDGFMLLDATGVQDPEEATECVINDSNVVGVVEEDLSYFTNLTFLDVGENTLKLEDLAVLENLEELHLHCNCLSELTRPELDGVEFFPRLHTLNMSFNQIPATNLQVLGELESLQRIDLSCNNLKRLPPDCSFFHSVTQLALENNKFSNPETILALATMPNLVEVNLNYNSFSSIPRIPDGDFPKLEVLGIASNQIVYFEDVYSLTQLGNLRRVVMWGNPIEKRQKDAEILFYEFGNLQVELIMDPPVPPKRKTGAFYAANTDQFIKVKDFRKILSSKQKRTQQQQQPSQTNTHPDEGVPSGEGGPSFFVTQTDAERAQGAGAGAGGDMGDGLDATAASAGSGSLPGVRTQFEAPGATKPGDIGHQSWIGKWDAPSQQHSTSLAGGTSMEGDPNMSVESRSGNNSRQQQQRRHLGRVSPALQAGDGNTSSSHLNMPSISSAAQQQQQQLAQARPFISSRASSGFGGSEVDDVEIARPNANVRSVMAELKRMLRQPLPSLHQPSFAASKGGSRRK